MQEQGNMFLETNKIVWRDKAPEEIQNNIPEWALYFEWIVSDGEQNRNWYIIKSDSWFFKNNRYVKDFLKTWSIHYNHNVDQPIGRPLSFEAEWDKIKVSWYVFDDVYTNWAIWRWLILGLSTWHITHESNWINTKTNTEMSNKEFWWEGWYERYTDVNWVWQVLKAEIVEFSFTSTRSNRASIVANNMAKTLWIKEEEALNLLNNKNVMTKEVKQNEVEEEVKTETPTEEVKPTEENKVEETKEDNKTLKLDENQIKEIKENLTKTIEENLLEELTNKFETKFNEFKKDFRETERNGLRAKVTTWKNSLQNILKK